MKSNYYQDRVSKIDNFRESNQRKKQRTGTENKVKKKKAISFVGAMRKSWIMNIALNYLVYQVSRLYNCLNGKETCTKICR